MENKENETITLDEVIKTVANMKKHWGNRILYVRMTHEFYDHLMSQRKHLFVKEGFEVNQILGITIIKVKNGKLRSFYDDSKGDWDMTPTGARA